MARRGDGTKPGELTRAWALVGVVWRTRKERPMLWRALLANLEAIADLELRGKGGA